MCSRSNVEALLEEHGSSLHGLATQQQALEKRQDLLAQEAQQRNLQLHELRREHRKLLKDFHELRDEYGAVRDCLTAANVVTTPNLCRHLSRRRAPRVFKRILEEPGLAMVLGSVMGVMSSMRLRETAHVADGLSKCLGLLKKRMPPDIYVLGGKNDSSPALCAVECFSPLRGEWQAVPPMRVSRYGCAAATLNGLLYVVGGHDGQKALASAERFDPTVKKWSRLPDMPTPRSRCAAVAVKGRLHVLGGRAESRLTSPQALPTERFDPRTCKWEALPAMPLAPLGCAAAELKGTIYAVGVNADRSMIVEVFDPAACTWSARAPVPRHRFGVAAASVAGSLYIAGGHNGQKAVAELERCDLRKQGHWEQLPPAPSARHGSAAAAAGGSFYLIGGDDGKSLATVERFDPMLKRWVTLPPLPTGRFGCAAAAAWA
ncbi:unnamed protein product [Durusdinium trenchii]|uniref:Kelch-like protein 4 n=2 Tax=Durusdinium trenchii TaxID=1381693 RepID=A0ABP0JGS8_9DINO